MVWRRNEPVKPDLLEGAGELWLMVDLGERAFFDEKDQALVGAVTEFIERNDLGEWDEEETSGARQLDVSFSVPRLRATAQALDAFFRQRYPDRRYFISDGYETTFDRLDFGHGFTPVAGGG